jgi:hypothetical protein
MGKCRHVLLTFKNSKWGKFQRLKLLKTKTLAADQSPKSFMELSTVIQRQATMNRFKYNSILIQEFLIQIDRGLLLSLKELFEVAVKKLNNKQLIAQDLKDILKVLF